MKIRTGSRGEPRKEGPRTRNYAAENRAETPYGHRWWSESAEQAVASIWANLDYWANTQQISRVEVLHQQARLYGNLPPASELGTSTSRLRSYRRQWWMRILNANVTKSCVDTLQSKTASNHPEPYWITSGGDHRLQRRAKQRTKFVRGINQAAKMEQKALRALFHCLLSGRGWYYVYGEDGTIQHQFVKEIQVWTDEVEATQYAPRQLHFVEIMDRSEAMARWPGNDEIFSQAKMARLGESVESTTTMDAITICRSWHMPSVPGKSKDGKFICSVTSGCLEEKSYDHGNYPLVSMEFSERPMTWYPSGLVEELEGIQTKIISLVNRIDNAQRACGMYRLWNPPGGPPVDQLTEEDSTGTVFESAAKPEWIIPGIVQPELYEDLERWIKRAYDLCGISQLDAQSEKPAGLKSEPALRTYDNISTQRFLRLGQRWERFHVDIGNLNIQVLKDMIADNAELKYPMRTPDKARIDEINLKDIALEEDDDLFFLRVDPISSLPQDLAGKTETVTELIQGGYIPQELGPKLLQFPDLERFEGSMYAERDSVEKDLDSIVDDGTQDILPEPWNNPVMCLKMATDAYFNGKNTGLDGKRMNLLREYMRAASKMAEEQTRKQIQVQQAMNPPNTAPANPAPTPISSLLPNVNQPQQQAA